MHKRPLLILHGWSGSSDSLKSLSSLLKGSGFKVVDIWLAGYLSMNDEITIQDLGQAMGKALKSKGISEKHHSFDVIVHSTGGIVVRQYLIHYFLDAPQRCPIKHLVMLAPANFGSPLASIGKSMIGRLRHGWNWNHLLQAGTRILDALELGSPITWQMAESDLFNPNNKIFIPKHIYTTILTGTDAYPKFKGIFHENGSDGTVYVSTANLNAKYIKLVFKNPKGHEVEMQKHYYEPIAFGVLPNLNHSSITKPKKDSGLMQTLIKSLEIKNIHQYQEHIKELNKLSEDTFNKRRENKKYHQYQHVVTRVHDQFKEKIEYYFLEFFQETDKTDYIMQEVHSEILEKVRTYSRDRSYRSFLFDATDMKKEILDKGKRVDMSLCAAALSKNIFYHDPQDYLTVVSQKDGTLLDPNTTLLLDIELPRIQHDNVFKFKKVEERGSRLDQ